MFKISTRGQYALMIMTELAAQPQNKFIPLKVLSHRHNLSVKYLEQILIQLSKSGLLEGTRGANGGYRLVKKAGEYTAGEILRSVEGDLNPCNIATRGNNIVKDKGNLSFWKDFENAINTFVDSITLEKIAEQNKDGFMYYI